MAYLCWCIVGYLFGSFPSGFVIFRTLRHDDIRNYGSGNIGATNINRTIGRKWAIIVAVLDMFKGAAALFVAYIAGATEPWLIGLTGLGAVCGHNYPAWLSFRGGKGVSTTFGVIMFFSPPLSILIAALAGIVWFLFLKYTRYVSIASLISLFSLPLFFFLTGSETAFVLVSFLLACLSCVRHRSNIIRLLHGSELKTGQKS